MAVASPNSPQLGQLIGSLRSEERPGSGLIVGSERSLRSEPPGLSPVFRTEIQDEKALDQWIAFGIDLRGLTANDARQSLAWLHERLAHGDAFHLDEHEEEVELIREPQRIAMIIDALLAREARGCAMPAGARTRPAEVVPARLTVDGTVLLESSAAPSLEAPFDVQFEGLHSVYQFRWPGGAVLRLPETIVRVRRRRHRRVRAPFRLRLRFTHPLWDSIVVNVPVHDLSVEGLSFDTDAARDVLYPGLLIQDLQVFWKGGVRLELGAKVCHVTQRSSADQHRVGLRLNASPQVAAIWRREVEGVLHPRTHRGAHSADEFWENYAASGYFNLSGKQTADFQSLRAPFEVAHEKLRQAPQVGASFAYSSAARVESVAHQVSPWEGSWVFYHFSRRPDLRPLSASDDDALLDLYKHAYEYVQEQPQAQWLVTYVQKVARFSNLIFNELTRRYSVQGRACVADFRAVEVLVGDRETADSRFEVGAATSEEATLTAAVIRSSRPAMYVAATGLSQSNLRVDPTLKAWSRAGLMRERKVLVARRDSVVVASAVIDIVEEGVHLFGLLDMVRLYPVSSVGHLAFGALLDEARRVFRALGRERFAYFCDSIEDRTALNRPDIKDLGEATMTILPVRLLPELLEHVFVLTSRRAVTNRPMGSEAPEASLRPLSELPSPPETR